MSEVLRVVLVDPNDLQREATKALLLGMDTVWLEAESSRYAFFADIVEQTSPDVAMVALDGDPEAALELLQQIARAQPACAPVVLSTTSDGQLILRAMRAGAREFCMLPVTAEDLVAAFDRIRVQKGGPDAASARPHKTIAIMGTIGGVGTTSIAVNLSCILASESETNTVALVDLDLVTGVADVFLDAIPDYTIVDVAQNVGRLDFTLLKRSLTKHSSGLYLLPRPVQVQDASFVTPESLQRVVGLLKATFTHVFLDLSKAFLPTDAKALELADDILLVTQLDLPSLRNTVRLLASLQSFDGLLDKVKIVLNRVGLGDGQISIKKASETIGRELFWQIPNDYGTMVEVRNNGIPLIEQAPRAAVTQSLVGLARALDGQDSGGGDGQGRGAESAKSRWLRFFQKARPGS